MQGFQALRRLGGRVGDLPDGAVRARQLRELDAPQPVRNVAPGIAAGVKADQILSAAPDPRQPGDPSRLAPAAVEDEWVIAGSCWSPVLLHHSEFREFQRGQRDFMTWALGISLLLLLATIFF